MTIGHLSKIPFSEFEFEYTRSRGPGGQHVNRTNSAVILRWSPGVSVAFNEQEKLRLLRLLPLNEKYELVLRSEGSRSQDQNKKDCLQKLDTLIQKALFIPKKRIKTKPTRSSVKKRVESKVRKGEVKKNRKKVFYSE